jgi:hypothetical protein
MILRAAGRPGKAAAGLFSGAKYVEFLEEARYEYPYPAGR